MRSSKYIYYDMAYSQLVLGRIKDYAIAYCYKPPLPLRSIFMSFIGIQDTIEKIDERKMNNFIFKQEY